MPRLCTTNIIRYHKEKGFTLKKARSRRYPALTITDADADDLALLADTPAQAESQLHSLEKAAKNIGLYVNSDKTEFICFKKKGVISTLNGKPIKPVEKFTYLGSNISSTESGVNTRIRKARVATNKLSVIWKSDLTDKLK